jgi:PKD repeat protein
MSLEKIMKKVIASAAVFAMMCGCAKDLAPSAAVSASCKKGKAPFTVVFSGYAADPENKPVRYYWDFGDNHYTNSQSPVHTYENPGTYDVIMRAEDLHGNKGTATETIIVR